MKYYTTKSVCLGNFLNINERIDIIWGRWLIVISSPSEKNFVYVLDKIYIFHTNSRWRGKSIDNCYIHQQVLAKTTISTIKANQRNLWENPFPFPHAQHKFTPFPLTQIILSYPYDIKTTQPNSKRQLKIHFPYPPFLPPNEHPDDIKTLPVACRLY